MIFMCEHMHSFKLISFMNKQKKSVTDITFMCYSNIFKFSESKCIFSIETDLFQLSKLSYMKIIIYTDNHIIMIIYMQIVLINNHMAKPIPTVLYPAKALPRCCLIMKNWYFNSKKLELGRGTPMCRA